jgi:long-subunit acyl-CoA synthetase (AMP-forming)
MIASLSQTSPDRPEEQFKLCELDSALSYLPLAHMYEQLMFGAEI